MATKLNNKGYVLVEIILASAIAFGIAFYMTDLTIKLKNKNDDILAETLAMTDQTIIQNKLVKYMNETGKNFNCEAMSIDNNEKTISYNGETIDILNEYVTIDLDNYKCETTDSNIEVSIPLKIESLNKNFDINLNYILSNPKLSSTLKLGDYVIYNPTTASYTLASATSGTTDQTIYPSSNLAEVSSASHAGNTLWRVIKIQSDGTVEVVSHRVTSASVYFRGQTGFLNFVAGLNDLAGAYETPGITIGHRHFGYSNQTQIITDTSMMTSASHYECSTGGSCNPAPVESKGGGDTGYLADVNLLKTAYNDSSASVLIATNPAGTAKAYWLASRYYLYSSSTYRWYGRNVVASGTISYNDQYRYRLSPGEFLEYNHNSALRPIVTLASGLTWSGAGTYASPWTLSTS